MLSSIPSLVLSEADLLNQAIHKSIFVSQANCKIKIAIPAGLSAKGDVKINSLHETYSLINPKMAFDTALGSGAME